jgi:pimeloyl-ACP methyl ester carboxylesterase
MRTIVLVHGLAGSKNHWNSLLPYLNGFNVINFEIPGHGESESLSFDWNSTVAELKTLLPASGPIIYILHSFAASLIPELIKINKKNDSIILVEGLIHLDDATWTKSNAFLDESLFENWVKKFRKGGRVALKYQLVKSHRKSDIDTWSKGFSKVNKSAIKIFSRKFVERLQNKEITTSLKNFKNNIVFIRGESSNLSKSSLKNLIKSNIAIHTISDSGHFPMIDNPKDVYEVIYKVSEGVFK